MHPKTEAGVKATAEHSDAYVAPPAMSPPRTSVPVGPTPQEECAEPSRIVFAPIYLCKSLQEATDTGNSAPAQAVLQRAWLAEARAAAQPRDWTAGCALFIYSVCELGTEYIQRPNRG